MPKKLELTQMEKDIFIEKYNSGISLRELEKELGHTRKVLSKILKENNIKIKDNTINSRKFYHNEDYFEVIDTEHKAYWLGFIYADGFVDKQNNVGITLSKIDESHLEKFKEDIEATNPINSYKGSGYNADGEFVRILLKSKKTKNDLINKGSLEQKTLLLEFPSEDIIPEHLLKHFIRGYMDGDGSISTNGINNGYKVGFVGTYNMLLGIQDYFQGQWKISQKNNAYQFGIGGNLQVLRILNHLYEGSTVYLDRKYLKYNELHSKYSES